MTDWSNDPVFGDLALRLRARSSGAIRGFELPAYVQTARLYEADGGAFEALRSVNSFADGFRGSHSELVAAAERHLVFRCMLAAHDHASRESAPSRLMGIVNVTPDSFSDGGRHRDPQRAIEHGLTLVRDGAEYLDVGGESTRPGADSVSADEELRRVFPVVCGLAARTNVPISIDTTKAQVAAECLAAGASIVNDVSAGRADPEMLGVVARSGAGFVAMHMLGTPRNMQANPEYDDVVEDVREFLRARCRAALDAGVARSKLWIDPGIGFGKTLEHNVRLLNRLSSLRCLGLPILLGVSRKSFIAAIEERAGVTRSEPHDRLGGTLAALALGVGQDVEILRVHDVREARQAALVARALAHE